MQPNNQPNLQPNMNPQNAQQGMGMNSLPKKSHTAAILAVLFGFLFLMSSIFAVWAFSSRQDYKNNVDQKISDATVVAVQEAETAKDAEFVELEKLPTKNYKGSATYGSLTFAYPKTWSVYAEEASTGVVLDLFAFPNVVPGVSNDTLYALRVEITSTTYDSELKKYDRDIESGEVRSSAYRPELVPEVLGVRLDGAIEREVEGSMVMLPLRDRTIKIYTQIPEFTNDFNNIVLPSIDFIP